MARFLHHKECLKCGSSDARGIYDDGGEYCFSCGDASRPGLKSLLTGVSHHSKNTGHHSCPDDCTSHFGNSAVGWLTKYGMTVDSLLKNNVCWSPSRQQLIFRFYDENGNLILWQARNFSPNAKSKYFTSGDHEHVLPIYYSYTSTEPSETLIVVEDCLSAIKLSAQRPLNGLRFDSMSVLGSHLPITKLNRLKRLYSNVVFWLDHDKGKEAQKFATQAKILGLSSRVIHTIDDPKAYTWEQLREILK